MTRPSLGGGGRHLSSEREDVETSTRGEGHLPLTRRGRAPPVELFSGENTETTLEDWLPSLTRAAEWNGWSEEEKLIQLAGHFTGRARQEWILMSLEDKASYQRSIEVLATRLGPGSKVLAAQDFRHIAQEEREKVSNFICRLEKTFRKAYGNDVRHPRCFTVRPVTGRVML